jgi:hypothetical protein
MEQLSFQPLYYARRLHLVNPHGDVGLITLWSDLDKVRRNLASIAEELFEPATSRVAVAANLYGDGMYAMFCNLLYNPQVRHLVAIGYDRGLPTCHEINSFLDYGLEDASMQGVAVRRIVGTMRSFPAHNGFDVDGLRRRLTFKYLGRLNGDLPGRVHDYLRQLPPPHAGSEERIRVDINMTLDAGYVIQPSEVNGHQVVRSRPLDCWKELVVRVVRFGRLVSHGDEQRLELLNVKAVISEPEEEPPDVLAKYGFDLEAFKRYESSILRPDPPEEGITYTYGNRLRGYFKQGDTGSDALETVIQDLKARPDTRHAFISLWDTAADLPPKRSDKRGGSPCLTAVSFRRHENRLIMTATFRVHNLLRAWLENAYGLIAIQRYVCEQLSIDRGPITVISHILGVNPSATDYERARSMAKLWTRDDDHDERTGTYALRLDPNGNFDVSIDPDSGRIIADHWAQGLFLKRYEGKSAERIARDIAGDMAVSLPAHALWLGQELARKEQMLRSLPTHT